MAGWKVSQSAADPSVVEPLTGAAVEHASGRRLRDGRQRRRRAGRLRHRRLRRTAAAGPIRPLRRHRRPTISSAPTAWFERWGALGRVLRAAWCRWFGPSSAIPPGSPACRSGASSSSARWDRCRGTPRSSTRGSSSARTTRRSRRRFALGVRHLCARAWASAVLLIGRWLWSRRRAPAGSADPDRG